MPIPRRSLRVNARSPEPDETTIGETIMSGSVPHMKPAQVSKSLGRSAMLPELKFTKKDEQVPFTIIALLDVCAVAVDGLAEDGTAERTIRYAGSISTAISHALDTLVDFHEKLDHLGRLEVSE